MRIRAFASVDDVADAIGQPVGPTDWLAVDESRVREFADATLDRQWIHVDQGRAERGPYGGLIAHGYLTLSLIPWFADQLFDFRMFAHRLNYGLNRVRFPAAVRVGQRLRAHGSLASLEPHPLGRLLTTDYSLEIEGGDKPACVAQTLSILVESERG